jgi:hypothetical protein
MTLNEIGLKHGTDKASSTHDYLDNYQKFLFSWKEKDFALLEIGVGNGGSLKMWKEYFPNARIYGIDNNPDVAGEGIFIGDQKDEAFLEKINQEAGPFSVIIDDGSHVGDDMASTWKFLFPKILYPGYYFIEDTHTLYSNHYSGENDSNGRTRGYNFFTDLPYHIDVAGRAMCGKQETAINWPMPDPHVPEYSRILKAAHFYPSLYIFERS